MRANASGLRITQGMAPCRKRTIQTVDAPIWDRENNALRQQPSANRQLLLASLLLSPSTPHLHPFTRTHAPKSTDTGTVHFRNHLTPSTHPYIRRSVRAHTQPRTRPSTKRNHKHTRTNTRCLSSRTVRHRAHRLVVTFYCNSCDLLDDASTAGCAACKKGKF